MHQQTVAHLDVKPDNILVTLTTSLHATSNMQLRFVCSGCLVDCNPGWMTGYRGTPGCTGQLQKSKKTQ